MQPFTGNCPKCGGDTLVFSLEYHVDNVTASFECGCGIEFDVIYDNAKIIDGWEAES